MREPKPNDIVLNVEDVGTCRFARRTIRDRFRIAAEFNRLTEGVDQPSPDFATMAQATASIRVLAVEVPDCLRGVMNLDEVDPLDSDFENAIFKVFVALLEKENSFRPKAAAKNDQAAGEGSVPVDRVLVPAEVQPSSD